MLSKWLTLQCKFFTRWKIS